MNRITTNGYSFKGSGFSKVARFVVAQFIAPRPNATCIIASCVTSVEIGTRFPEPSNFSQCFKYKPNSEKNKHRCLHTQHRRGGMSIDTASVAKLSSVGATCNSAGIQSPPAGEDTCLVRHYDALQATLCYLDTF